MLHSVLHAYGFDESAVEVKPFGNGLINHTWKLSLGDSEFIMQRINSDIFKQPANIAYNIRTIASYLQLEHPNYLFVVPLRTKAGEEYFFDGQNGYYRLFPFVPGSHTENVMQSPAKAGEAAMLFGKFTRLLSEFDVTKLKITLPDFHNLTLRYQQFLDALTHGNKERISSTGPEIKAIQDYGYIKTKFEAIIEDPAFRLRVTHHDAKISNVLFNDKGQGLCVIDLDTVMPGYFISDVGDMMRTYLSPVSEEEKDLGKIEVREDFFKAIVDGYGAAMNEVLTPAEKEHFVYAGKFMIYMQAIRFLTDYLNNDIYYTANYPEHNLVRARNQLVLLQRLIEKEAMLLGAVKAVS